MKAWTLKKHDGKSIDAFELGSWRRFLRIPWLAKNIYAYKSNTSRIFIKEQMTKLKLF